MQNVLHSLHFDTFFTKTEKPSNALYIKVLDGFSIYLHSCDMSPEGIEPPSQEPESYVISITLRRLFRKAQLLHSS